MARLYVCPVIGVGTDDDPQRPLIADLGVTEWSACIDTDALGKPRRTWSIVRAQAADWSTVEANAQCFHLTADALDGPVPQRVVNALSSRGVATKQQLGGFATLRVLADWLVKQHYGHSSLAVFAAEV